MEVSAIRPADLAARHRSGEAITLIDVRTPAEFEEVHIPFAQNIPLDRLTSEQEALRRGGARSIFVICRSGGRGRQACSQLLSAGFPNVVNVEGGTMAWTDQGFEVVRGRETISLERQVRIAAGALVLLGLALGYFVHSGFNFATAFVGAGLVFAGVTDTCAMGLVLAKLPWNNRLPSCKILEGRTL